MKLKSTHTKSSRKTKILIAVIALFLLIGGASVYALYVNNTRSTQKSDYETNLERSDAEKKASEDLKNNPEKKVENNQNDIPQTPEKSDQTSKAQVNVLLTTAGIYNGKVSAGGMVTNYIEEGGVCEYIFTNGDKVVKVNSITLINPTSMSCKTVNFSSNDLPVNGVWKVTLSYSSSGAAGSSNEIEITK
jgi:uncharacterized membrane protein YiaA